MACLVVEFRKIEFWLQYALTKAHSFRSLLFEIGNSLPRLQ
jgi:hypothetical protein